MDANDCELWTGALANGRNPMKWRTNVRRARWFALHPDCPRTTRVRTTCGEPRCVRADHLIVHRIQPRRQPPESEHAGCLLLDANTKTIGRRRRKGYKGPPTRAIWTSCGHTKCIAPEHLVPQSARPKTKTTPQPRKPPRDFETYVTEAPDGCHLYREGLVQRIHHVRKARIGFVPPDMRVQGTCGNPVCVNPAHTILIPFLRHR